MDVERIEAAGTAPLRPLLDEIAAAADPAELAGVLGRRQRAGGPALFGAFVATDAKDSTRYLLHLSQSGLGLPDESYYREDAYAEIRDRLPRAPGPAGRAGRAARAGCAGGDRDGAGDRAGRAVLGPGDQPGRGEDLHPDDRCGAAPARTEFDWDRWLAGIEAPAAAFDEVDRAAAQLRRGGRRAVGRAADRAVAGLAGHPHGVRAGRVPQPGRGRRGLRLLRAHPVGHPAAAGALEARGISLVEGGLGEAVGRLYVERHFPASAKERMVDAGREPGRGLPAEHQRAGLDGPSRPGSGRWPSWPGSRRRSATRTAGRTTRACGSSPTTCSATSCAPAPGPPTTSSPRSARRSTAPSG